MRSRKGWLACLMALALGIFVLGAPPKASASFVLALQEDGGVITPVASAASFNTLSFSGTFGDYSVDIFSAVAHNGAGGSNLLSSTTSIGSLVATSHTLSLYVSNQDYTLPVGPTLRVVSGMGGTIGSEPGFIGAATFRMWADAGNGLITIPGTFSNGLQNAIPNGTTFDTGDGTGLFTRGVGPFSLTDRVTFVTTGLGDFNFATHIRVSQVPEPNATLIMFMVGFLGLFLGVRRRKS